MAIARFGEKTNIFKHFCVASGVCAMSRLVAVFQKLRGAMVHHNRGKQGSPYKELQKSAGFCLTQNRADC